MGDATTSSRVRRRGWWPALAVVAVGVALLSSHALSQPYLAAGGFGRPWLVAGPGVVPTVAVAADEDRAVVVWADGEGVWLRETSAPDVERSTSATAEQPAINLSGPGSIRGVSAAMAGGEPAVAWLERDLRSGMTAHVLSWRGHQYALFEAGQEVELQVGSGDGRPWVLAARRFDGQAHLQLFTVDAAFALRAPITLHRTSLAVRGATALPSTDPRATVPAWVGWLEGETSSGPFGADPEWSAYVMSMGDAGSGGSAPLALGRAGVLDERQRVALGPASAGAAPDGPLTGASPAGAAAVPPAAALALWLGDDGALRLTTLNATGAAVEIAATSELGEPGRPLAVLGERAFWLSGEFVRSVALGAGGATAAAGSVEDSATAGEPISVAWSPLTIAGADLASVGDGADQARTTIAWYGRKQGGAAAVYATDDRQPFTPGLADRIGATMGWSPWALWQEAVGQALTSLLVGLVAVMALSPLLFVFSFLIARVRGVSRRPAVGGVALGVLAPVAVASVIAVTFPDSAVARLGPRGLVGGGTALALGAMVAYVANFRADREAQLGVLFSAVSAVFVAVSAWAMIEYRVWAPMVGLG